MAGFALNPPNTPIVMDDGRTVEPAWYRWFSRVQGAVGTDLVALIQAAPLLTYTPNTTLTADKVLTQGAGLSFTSAASTFTVALAVSGVTAATYGSASQVAQITVDQYGRATTVANVAIAISAAAVTSGTLAVARGGTGIASYTTGDIIYASGATTLTSLADVATGNALISGGVGVAPAWGKVGLTTHVSGTLPVANGGTSATTASGARTSLGVAIGSDVQAWSANLDEYAAVNPTAAGLAILDDATAADQRTTLGFADGTYTPGLTNVANLTASTAYACQYMRVGNTVTVSGRVDIDPTLAATATQLGIDLPIASNFANANECGGMAAASGIAAQVAAIRADAANNRAELVYISGDVTNQPMYFSLTYLVI